MANLKARNNPFPSILMVEGDPEALEADAAVGQRRLAVGTDHLLYLVDDAGVKTAVGGAGGGAVATDAIWDAAGDLAVGSGANTAARLAIGSTDRILKVVAGTPAWGLPHSFGCIISGTSTALGTAAFTSLAFGAADTYDPDGYHDPSSNNTKMTIPAGLGGQYRLHIRMTWPSSGSANTDRRIGYKINAGGDNILNRHTYSVTSTAVYDSASVDIVLAAGDTVECRQYTAIASTITGDYGASLFLIGV
jgi:hypothetical protein